jgi:predicted amidophosphoribosyltransferase
MKYEEKCPCCNRKATKKFRGVYFCENCVKDIRKANKIKKVKGVYGSIPVFSLGQGCTVYRDVLIKLK